MNHLTYDATVTTTTRTPLTRERIIEAAIVFADAHGVDELSMRKLGAVLGVEAMSLYNHVANKDDIYDGMIDHVFNEIPLPDSALDWKEQTRRLGHGAMEQFGRHPWVVYLLMARGNFGPGALHFMDHVLGLLLEAGFGEEDAHHAWQMLASHTMGYAFQSSTGAGMAEKDYAALVETRSAEIMRLYPNVARLTPLIVDCAWDREYLFGLEIIIDGLDARLG
jgi:AcrR family transcriptional regulator